MLKKLSKKERKNLYRILISLFLFVIVLLIDKVVSLDSIINHKLSFLLPLSFYLFIYIIIGYDVIRKAILNLIHGNPLDENFLMLVATFGAFALGIYRGLNNLDIEGFDEACAVLIFYQVGEFFQRYAVSKSRKSISKLMDIRPDYASLLVNNEIKTVDPSEVNVDDIIVINPGEKIPLDGIIIEGETSIDTSSLTGESLLKDATINDEVISGTINLTSQIKVKVQKAFYDSTVSKILDLVENASMNKSKAENFISKFARVYTPLVVGLAILLAIVPSIFTGDWSIWIYRALNFLVVSCPCALVISIPLTFFAGIGAASKKQILIKGSNYLEKFNKIDTIVFDKTGTLTKGNFVVQKIISMKDNIDVLKYAAIAENGSNHPIAKSIILKYNNKIDEGYVLTNISGKGVLATNGNNKILCGNEKLMSEYDIYFEKTNETGTVVYVALNDEYIGYILISDEIKEESKNVINDLQKNNINCVMLTGDNYEIASYVAKALNINDFKASLLPSEKVSIVEKLIENKKVVCFVGDGINDAPTLMRADIGIAMGGIGSDAAVEASDIVLMKDNLSCILLAKKITNKTMRIVLQNIVLSLFIKIGILVLSAFGLTNMWVAIFGDVGVAILAILNAMRAFKID